MATDFWASSHHKRWTVDRVTLKQARQEDMQLVEDSRFYDMLNIFFANAISRFGKKLTLRQRVIATATIFFKRFYLKNSYSETDPFIVIAACCYVAAKAEESPMHIKNVATEARNMFHHEPYAVKHFSADPHKLAEMEFYLLSDLECDLTVFHPYRTLLSLCCKEGTGDPAFSFSDAEQGELGFGMDDSDAPRYWGSGAGRLEIHESALQMAWFIINDTYRSDICLLYPPHMIAIAALYMTLALHEKTKPLLNPSTSPPTSTPSTHRRSSRTMVPKDEPTKKPQDAVDFLAGLNVSLPQIATISQEIINLYAVWSHYNEDAHSSARSHFPPSATQPARPSPLTPTASKRPQTPNALLFDLDSNTPTTPQMLMRALVRMREARFERITQSQPHGQTAQAGTPGGGAAVGTPGRRVAVNKRLERAQAAG